MTKFKKPQPVQRIIAILKRLYAFERVHVNTLADQYGVDRRTIRRDLAKIADAGIPLLSKRGEYRIDGKRILHLQRLPATLLQSFASNAGLGVECFGGEPKGVPFISFAIAYNGIDTAIAEPIIESIKKHCKCRFRYTNNSGAVEVRTVSPIKLYTAKGKWYLLAKDDTRQALRLFDFLKIKSFRTLNDIPQNLTEADIAQAHARASIWSSDDDEPFGVRLYASAYATRYLREVPLHPSQQLDMPHADGSAEFTYTITHPMELLPEIKNWIPHLHIIEPKALRDELRRDLEMFLREMGKMDKYVSDELW